MYRIVEEGEDTGAREEEGYCCQEITYYFGANSIYEEVAGFSPLWFPRGKTLCSLSLVFDCCACYSLSKDPNIMLS